MCRTYHLSCIQETVQEIVPCAAPEMYRKRGISWIQDTSVRYDVSCTFPVPNLYQEIQNIFPCLALIFGIKWFHTYLYGSKFTLLTDHKPLTTILGPHNAIPTLAAARLQRWAIILSAHQYNIVFRQKTEEHGNTDGLSTVATESSTWAGEKFTIKLLLL